MRTTRLLVGSARARGDNSVRVVISINSKAAEPRSMIDTFEFKIDSDVITDNKKLSAVILSTFIPQFVIYEYWYRPRVTPAQPWGPGANVHP